MNLPIYTDTEIALALNYADVIQTLDEAYADWAQGKAAVLARQRCAAGDTKFASMGALWAARRVAASKSYPTAAGQFSFLISLFDTQANMPIAVMQAQEITRFRTAAQTALVASRLGRRQVKKVALFGAGLQGRAQVEALSERVAFDELAIVDPQLSVCPALALKQSAQVHLSSAPEAVQGASIVITATRSQTPVLDGQWLADDALVVAIGISSDSGREIDDASFDRASRVVVEWMPQSMAEAGDVLAWLRHAPDGKNKVIDLPALYRQDWPAGPGIQIFKSVGTGLADTACAWLAWQQLQKQKG